MKKAVFICFFLSMCSIMLGQTNADTIVLKKVLGGYEVRQNGKILTMNQLSYAVMADEIATYEMKKAVATNSFGSIFAYVGGALIGYPVGWAIGGGKMNWSMFGIGIGLSTFTIPISRSINRRIKTAVEAYNNGLRVPALPETSEIKIGIVTNGIGLSMTF